MTDAYLDANVVLRHLTGDPEKMAEAALRTFEAAGRGEMRLRLTAVTLAEVVWVLESYYGHPRADIATTLTELLQADGLEVPEGAVLTEALALYREHRVDFADALLGAVARREGPPAVCSFDEEDFDRLPGLQRIRPG